jgi:hypothetical protein
MEDQIGVEMRTTTWRSNWRDGALRDYYLWAEEHPEPLLLTPADRQRSDRSAGEIRRPQEIRRYQAVAALDEL